MLLVKGINVRRKQSELFACLMEIRVTPSLNQALFSIFVFKWSL